MIYYIMAEEEQQTVLTGVSCGALLGRPIRAWIAILLSRV
jgi:hypothetical protein